MNPQMMMQMMNNMQNTGEWCLIFSKKDTKENVKIQINPDDFVSVAISKYKLKSSDNDRCKFVFKGKELCPTLTISQAGLQNGSEILVNTLGDLGNSNYNEFNLIFIQKNSLKKITLKVNSGDLVSDIIKKYRDKTLDKDDSKFIYNGKELNPKWTLNEAGLHNESQILVISLANLEGA